MERVPARWETGLPHRSRERGGAAGLGLHEVVMSKGATIASCRNMGAGLWRVGSGKHRFPLLLWLQSTRRREGRHVRNVAVVQAGTFFHLTCISCMPESPRSAQKTSLWPCILRAQIEKRVIRLEKHPGWAYRTPSGDSMGGVDFTVRSDFNAWAIGALR